MLDSVKERIFIVGCPRSGTTLLQSFLAAHPDINSFPESKFFHNLIVPGSKRSRFNIASLGSRSYLNQFLLDINHEEMINLLPRYAIFTNQYITAFIEILDRLTIKQNKHLWVEKTPSHLHRIKYIEKYVLGAKFIHIIRPGADVVASLFDVTHKNPEIWCGSQSIDQCINRWINDVKISCNNLHKTNHFLVKYEHLVENPQYLLEKICDFLNIDFRNEMLQESSFYAQKIIRKRESWKASVFTPIQQDTSVQSKKIFDDKQIKYILDKINEINLDDL